MLKRLNKDNRNKNGQFVVKTGTLPLFSTACPACPERSRKVCSETAPEILSDQRHHFFHNKIHSLEGQKICTPRPENRALKGADKFWSLGHSAQILPSGRKGTSGFKPMGLHFERGQQVIEYALLIMTITVALTAMAYYSRRGMQAFIKGSTDQLGKQQDALPIVEPDTIVSSASSLHTLTDGVTNISSSGEERISNYESGSRSKGTTNSTIQRTIQ